MSSTSITPLTFTGVSSYSSSFQQILNRAVSIASIPITKMQTDQTNILSKKQLLSQISSTATALSDAMSKLGDMGQSRAISGTSSNEARVIVDSVVDAKPATYVISKITGVAQAASMATAGYADKTTTPVLQSPTRSGSITIDGVAHNFTLDEDKNNLNGLRDKINSMDLGVTATILTTGTGDTPYYLSITADSAGSKPINVIDDPTVTEGDGALNQSLKATGNDGSNADFYLNGIHIVKSSNLINDVVPGMTFEIKSLTESDTETVTLTLSSSRSSLETELNNFITAYNGMQSALASQVGSNAGLLSGDSTIVSLQDTMRQIAGYQGDGVMKSLSQFGVVFDDSGVASLDTDVFDNLSDAQVQQVFTFLGSQTSGFGELNSLFDSVTDSVSGSVAIETQYLDQTDQYLTDQINVISDRILTMQNTLQTRLQAADALLAGLESQKTVLDASIQSLTYTLYGKSNSN